MTAPGSADPVDTAPPVVATPARPPRSEASRLGVRPGLRWDLYPLRPEHQAAWFAPWWQRLAIARVPRRVPLSDALAVRAAQHVWLTRAPADWAEALADLRARLAARPWSRSLRDLALGCVCAAALRHLGRDPFDEQILCAQVLCDGHLAEMATGEGKTLAIGLAALVAALAGSPVHVMTANDYLAHRDAQALAPLAAVLGLDVGVVTGPTPPDTRRRAYAASVTYATAKELAFDHLRDTLLLREAGGDLQRRAAALAGGSPPPLLLRGLCVALVDEADSLLIDEATMPLVLSQPHDDAEQRAACFQALALARELEPGTDALLDAGSRRVHWTAAGQQRLETLSKGFGAAWLNRRHREDLVAQALVALHTLAVDRDYVVRDGGIELLDAVTGRRAPGRVWSRALHTLVELKEGCRPSLASRTAAQTSFQRFFSRYHHLAGTSGTLADCRSELAAVYGKAVRRIPLRQRSRRQTLPLRLFADPSARDAAVVARVQALQAAGRPVLVGVASVAAAEALCARLSEAGVRHRRLDARHDAAEAAVVAAAGRRGSVTVATAMAGRGTDIELGPGVADVGGLHVIDLQDSDCARTRRQLVGRAARQGDPGSAETWLLRPGHGALSRVCALARATSRLRQRLHGWKGRQQRRRLLEQDLTWQQTLAFRARHAG